MKALAYGAAVLVTGIALFLAYLFGELFIFSSQWESYGSTAKIHGLFIVDRTWETRAGITPEICEEIPAWTYAVPFMSGGGSQVMYLRSYCYWQAAADQKDPALCGHVAEKKHWFFDGSAYTPEGCRDHLRGSGIVP